MAVTGLTNDPGQESQALHLAARRSSTARPGPAGRVVLLAACWLAVPPARGAPAQETSRPALAPAPQRLEREGVVIEWRAEPADSSGSLREGRDADLLLSLRDTAGTPVTALRPSMWIDARAEGPGAAPVSCSDKVRAFLQGSLAARPTVDVNSYYLVTLNREPNLSVIDPLVDFGGSRLMALVGLDAPGEDWALDADGRWLYVSQPSVDRVAVVDTALWKTVLRVEAGPRPARLLWQQDAGLLWVANDPEGTAGGEGGVTVVDASGHKVRGRVVTGAGPHALAFGRDQRVVYVANRAAGTVSIVDTERLVNLRDVKVGPAPVSVDYSALSDAAYVADAGDGSLSVLDGRTHEVRARLVSKPGLARVRFSPDGRWGFLLNPREDLVEVIDSSSDRVAHRLVVEGGPEEVAFTDNSAYFRPRRSELVSFVALKALGGADAPGVFRFPGGEEPPEQAGPPALADSLAAAPEGDAMLVTNAADETIYYYKEGMAVPMGHYQNYRRRPLGVLVVDRSLRERRPGLYAARVTLPPAGRYDVALLLDAPRVVHCFDLEVEPAADAPRPHAQLKAELLLGDSDLVAGRPARVRFRLRDGPEGAPHAGLPDVRVLAVQPPGVWQQRGPARAVAGREAEGLYEAEFTFPQAALYYFFFESPSLGLGFNQVPFVTAPVGRPEETGAGPVRKEEP